MCYDCLLGELSLDQDECSLGMFLGGGAEGWGADEQGGPRGAHASSDGFVKSLLVMEYADLGTLHAHLLAGRLRGNLVRAELKCQVVEQQIVLRFKFPLTVVTP